MTDRPTTRPTLPPNATKLERTPRPHLVEAAEPPRRRQGKRVAQPTIAVYVRLDVDLASALEEQASQRDLTKTEAVELALRAWLDS